MRGMSVRGRVENGVVVPNLGFSLPEGAEVVIHVCAPPSDAPDSLPEPQRRRVRELMDHIASLPGQNPGDSFSGADHDQVLYGQP